MFARNKSRRDFLGDDTGKQALRQILDLMKPRLRA